MLVLVSFNLVFYQITCSGWFVFLFSFVEQCGLFLAVLLNYLLAFWICCKALHICLPLRLRELELLNERELFLLQPSRQWQILSQSNSRYQSMEKMAIWELLPWSTWLKQSFLYLVHSTSCFLIQSDALQNNWIKSCTFLLPSAMLCLWVQSFNQLSRNSCICNFCSPSETWQSTVEVFKQ